MGTANVSDDDVSSIDSSNSRNNQHTYPTRSNLEELDMLSMACHCSFVHTRTCGTCTPLAREHQFNT